MINKQWCLLLLVVLVLVRVLSSSVNASTLMYYNPPSFTTLSNLSSLPPHQLTPHVLQLTVLCHFPIQAIVLFSHELGSIDADTILDEYRMREKLENRIQAMKHRYRYDTILIRWYSKTQQNRIWIRVYKWSIFIIINHLLDIWKVCVCVCTMR